MSAIDPVAFLRSTAPFHALPAALFDGAAKEVEVAYYPAGARLVRAGGEPLRHLYVIRKGAVRLERHGQTLQVLEEGETFGYTSLLTGTASIDVLVEEDLVAFRLPAGAFQDLLADARFAGHFAVGMSQRLKASLDQSPVAAFPSDLTRDVLHLVRRPAVWIGPDATVATAAQVMRDEGVSSVLVRTDPPGILTDRDFRNRVLAEERGPDTALCEVATRPLRTVAGTTPMYVAWTMLIDAGVHHLPVTRGDEIVGVVTSSDLLRQSAHGPVAVLRAVERLAGREGLPGYATMLAEMVSALVAGHLDVSVVAGFVARLNDTLLRRIVRWAERDLGPAPVPYAWIAFGSEGRMEQTLLTDQDNALVYAEEGAAHRDWFQAFAERVNLDLEAAGFPRCAGGYMARSWHGTIGEWARRFGSWIDSPQPQALLAASIFFDYRRVAGDLSLDALDAIVATAPGNVAFLRFFAKSAMEFRPPPLLLLRVRGTSSEVDLKLQGISPIVFLARSYALEAGSRARNTLERIDAAVRAGLVDAEARERTAEAYRFLLGLRLRLQLRALAAGGQATNRVSLSQLSAVERSRLKESFRAIKGWQDRGAFHYRTDF